MVSEFAKGNSFLRLVSEVGVLTRALGKGMMKRPQVGRTIAALENRVEESPHSTEYGAGETPGRSNLPDRATENKQPHWG